MQSFTDFFLLWSGGGADSAAIRRLSLATFPIGLQKLLEYESSLGGRCCGRGAAAANLESPAELKFRETSCRYSAAARTSVSEEEAVEGQEEEEEAVCERSYQCCCGGGGRRCCGRSTCGG